MNSAPNPTVKYCAQCGNKLEVSAAFCSACGVSQVSPANIGPALGMQSDKPATPDYAAGLPPSSEQPAPMIKDRCDAASELLKSPEAILLRLEQEGDVPCEYHPAFETILEEIRASRVEQAAVMIEETAEQLRCENLHHVAGKWMRTAKEIRRCLKEPRHPHPLSTLAITDEFSNNSYTSASEWTEITQGKPRIDLPADVHAVLVGAVPWAIWGSVIFGVIAAIGLSNGAAHVPIMKAPFFVLMLTAGACGGAGLRWGMIAGAASGGRKLIHWIVWILGYPLSLSAWIINKLFRLDDPEVIREAKAQRNYIYAFFILYVAGANLAIYLGSLIFAAIAGIPYGLYVFFFKRVAINTLGYVICTIIGSILAFFMLFLLAWTSDPSVPH